MIIPKRFLLEVRKTYKIVNYLDTMFLNKSKRILFQIETSVYLTLDNTKCNNQNV